jgi:ATP-dependent DNA ligase
MCALGGEVEQSLGFSVMPRVVKRSASLTVKAGPSRRSRPNSPLPVFVPPQLFQLVEKPPSGPQWVHEIKLDGFRIARIDNGRVQLLTRTGLDWTAKYPSGRSAGKRERQDRLSPRRALRRRRHRLAELCPH